MDINIETLPPTSSAQSKRTGELDTVYLLIIST